MRCFSVREWQNSVGSGGNMVLKSVASLVMNRLASVGEVIYIYRWELIMFILIDAILWCCRMEWKIGEGV